MRTENFVKLIFVFGAIACASHAFAQAVDVTNSASFKMQKDAAEMSAKRLQGVDLSATGTSGSQAGGLDGSVPLTDQNSTDAANVRVEDNASILTHAGIEGAAVVRRSAPMTKSYGGTTTDALPLIIASQTGVDPTVASAIERSYTMSMGVMNSLALTGLMNVGYLPSGDLAERFKAGYAACRAKIMEDFGIENDDDKASAAAVQALMACSKDRFDNENGKIESVPETGKVLIEYDPFLVRKVDGQQVVSVVNNKILLSDVIYNNLAANATGQAKELMKKLKEDFINFVGDMELAVTEPGLIAKSRFLANSPGKITAPKVDSAKTKLQFRKYRLTKTIEGMKKICESHKNASQNANPEADDPIDSVNRKDFMQKVVNESMLKEMVPSNLMLARGSLKMLYMLFDQTQKKENGKKTFLCDKLTMDGLDKYVDENQTGESIATSLEIKLWQKYYLKWSELVAQMDEVGTLFRSYSIVAGSGIPDRYLTPFKVLYLRRLGLKNATQENAGSIDVEALLNKLQEQIKSQYDLWLAEGFRMADPRLRDADKLLMIKSAYGVESDERTY